MSERIVRAAIRVGEDIYDVPPPGRHGDIFQRFPATHRAQPDDQGFTTNTERFVGREEALAIAKAANQIIRWSSGPNPRHLFSEDLW